MNCRRACRTLAPLAAAALAALPACDGTQGAGPVARPPRPVQLVAVGAAELPTKVSVSGVLAAQEELVVALQVPGRLATLSVDVGDLVAKGAVIATLAARDFALDVARAEASVAAAEAVLGVAPGAALDHIDVEAVPSVREANAVVVEAKQRRDRVAAMVQGQINSGSELDTVALAVAVAENRLQRARDEVRTSIASAQLRRIELQQAEKRREDSTVEAPWAGRIAQRHVVAGQVLAAGAPVVTMLRVDPLRLRLRVPDRLAMGVAGGQLVEFTVDGDAAETKHTGRVVRTGPAIDRGDRTRLVEAEVENKDGMLLPGAFCRAMIVTAPAVPVVTVPRTAVVSFAGVDRVFTVQPGKDGAQKTKGVIVQLGRTVGDQVEVVRGVAAGTRVVRDASGLSPEMAVAVAE